MGGGTCFSAALASLLKMLLGAWKQILYVRVCVHSWVYAGLCPSQKLVQQSSAQGQGMGDERLQRSHAC